MWNQKQMVLWKRPACNFPANEHPNTCSSAETSALPALLQILKAPVSQFVLWLHSEILVAEFDIEAVEHSRDCVFKQGFCPIHKSTLDCTQWEECGQWTVLTGH